jgi:nicotinamidase-related amidase
MTSTALLIMDVQQGIVDRAGGEAGYLPGLGSAITAARRAGIAVIYVAVGFRAGYPEVSPRTRASPRSPGPGGSPTVTRPARCIRPSPRRPVTWS